MRLVVIYTGALLTMLMATDTAHATALHKRRAAEPAVSRPVETAPMTAEPAADMTLGEAIALAYRLNPTLAAKRYDLRATDQTLGIALSETRPNVSVQINGQYDKTVPGRTTQVTRFGAASPIITNNTLGAQLIINQPLYTGGKARADTKAAYADIAAGQAGLRASEGDLLLQTITAYVDVRRDTRTLALRDKNLAQLVTTLAEVKARREAGELTRTDVALADTQLHAEQTQVNLAREQLEQSRTRYAVLIGSSPAQLAPEPALPLLPATIDEAFAIAEAKNPELSQASAIEDASRQRIASAAAALRPSVVLQGVVGASGQGTPFYLHNEDQTATGRAVVTIPITSGGQNHARVAQALNTNSADRLRIESTRRAMIENVANAWNQMTTARRNVTAQQAQRASAAVFYEGTFEEYRAGLRSTFDVLYAQGTLRDSEIALMNSQHDLYVAQAALLRHVGLLEVRHILTVVDVYDASRDVARVRARYAIPWDAPVRVVRALENVVKPRRPPNGLPIQSDHTMIAPAPDVAPVDALVTHLPIATSATNLTNTVK